MRRPGRSTPSSPKPAALRLPTFDEWHADLRGFRHPREQRAFIRRSLRPKLMLHVFGRYFFPKWIEGTYATPEIHMELIRFFASPESGAALEPRGFSKTTWEKVDTLHDVVYERDPLQVFYGATQRDVDFVMDDIRGELEDNDALREVYGELVPPKDAPRRKWNNKHIRTMRPRRLPDGTWKVLPSFDLISRVAGKGRGLNVRSKRPKKVRIDDGETDQMVRSTDQRDKYWRWITQVVEPGLDPDGGVLKMLGTVLHPKAAVLRYYDERGGVKRSSIEDGRSVWPERFPTEKLYRIRDGYVREDGKRILGIGTMAFLQEYQNTPIGEGLTIFRQEWLDDNTYTKATLPPLSDLHVVMAVDPAAGKTSVADDYGYCVIGQHKVTGVRYVLASGKYHGGIGVMKKVEGKWLFSGAFQWFHDIYVKWDPVEAGIEAMMTVQAFWQMLVGVGIYRVRKLLASMGIGGRTAPKEERAKLVSPHMEGGVVKFDPAQKDLYDQLVVFPAADVKDDVADAFFHANSMLDVGGDTMEPSTTKTLTGTSGIKTRKF